jgi:uncharacterized protein DUF742
MNTHHSLGRRHWKVRPYMRRNASGRGAGDRRELFLHTLVSTANRFDPVLAASLAPTTRRLYEAARTTCSVAELSAHSGLSLGVTRLLINDLIKINQLVIHDNRPAHNVRPAHDIQLLERLRAGLLNLT